MHFQTYRRYRGLSTASVSASIKPTLRSTVHILEAQVSHTPIPKREPGWGCRKKGHALAVDCNTHGHMGGGGAGLRNIQTLDRKGPRPEATEQGRRPILPPAPCAAPPPAIRTGVSLSLLFCFLETGPLYITLTVLELTLIDQGGLTNPLVSAS